MQIDESLLPAILQEIAGLIGLPATLKLAQHYGGVRLYVPKKLSSDHVLASVVGYDAAVRLAEHFGGLPHFDIPKAQAVSIALRNSKIRESWQANMSVRQIALKYGLTERYIRRVLAASEQQNEPSDPKQRGLFDAIS